MKPFLRLCSVAVVVALGACSSTPEKPRPAELPPAATTMVFRQAWVVQVGASPVGVFPRTVRDQVLLVGASGQAVLALDADNGQERWRVALTSPVAAGVGSDGDAVAVVTRENELVVMGAGEVRWRQRLTAAAHTAPLVAGRRVFVLTADRTVQAFDGETGRRLWSQPRTGEPLVLAQPGVLLAVGDTLVVGQAGRLVGLNPLSGAVRWEAPVATARGTNEVERLVDLVGPASRQDSTVCVRAYASAVGCVDAQRGMAQWSRPALGSVGLAGDERVLFGVESDGRVLAWQRASGEQIWAVDRFKYRDLGAPAVLGGAVVMGDRTGLVHLVSRDAGTDMARLSTDGSPVLAPPLLVGSTLVVQTRNGGVFAWRPQ